MNRRWVQNLLVIAVFATVILASCMDDTAPAPAVTQVIEKAKQQALADPKFNELYREGKYLTTFGDNR